MGLSFFAAPTPKSIFLVMPLIISLFLLLAVPTYSFDKFSTSECAQDVTSTQEMRQIDGMVLSPSATLGLVIVYFKGDFIITNDSHRRRGAGGTIRLLRDGEEIDKLQIYFPVRRGESVFLPLSLHAFDFPNVNTYTYSVDWASDSTNKVSMRVNCRSLTAIVEVPPPIIE